MVTNATMTRRTAPVFLGVFLVGLWALISRLGIVSPALLPTPTAVVQALLAQVVDPRFLEHLGQTLLEAVGGASLGILVGVPLGAIIHRWRWLDAAVAPYLGATQSIPAVALAPLLVLWVGYGTGAVVLLCALMVFFPIVIATAVGLHEVPPELRDAAAMDGASGWRVLSEIEFPHALPVVLSGVRNGVALSLTGAVVGELVMGGSGLGSLMVMQRDLVDTPGMFATILVIALCSATGFQLIHHLEGKLDQ